MEEQKSSSPESTYPVQMAGPHTCRNTGGAPTNDSGTPESTSAVSRAPIPAPAQAFAFTSALAPDSILG